MSLLQKLAALTFENKPSVQGWAARRHQRASQPAGAPQPTDQNVPTNAMPQAPAAAPVMKAQPQPQPAPSVQAAPARIQSQQPTQSGGRGVAVDVVQSGAAPRRVTVGAGARTSSEQQQYSQAGFQSRPTSAAPSKSPVMMAGGQAPAQAAPARQAPTRASIQQFFGTQGPNLGRAPAAPAGRSGNMAQQFAGMVPVKAAPTDVAAAPAIEKRSSLEKKAFDPLAQAITHLFRRAQELKALKAVEKPSTEALQAALTNLKTKTEPKVKVNA